MGEKGSTANCILISAIFCRYGFVSFANEDDVNNVRNMVSLVCDVLDFVF